MNSKQKALWMIGKSSGQTKAPFSTIDDAIAACDEIIKIFYEYHPPLAADYWKQVKECLEQLKEK